MARIKRAQIRKKRISKLFARTKGFHLARNNTLRQAKEAVLKAKAYAFSGRKQKKRQFRSLWIQRLSAALMAHDFSYSRFIHGLSLAGIDLNRKQLSELAIHEAETFASIVGQAKAAVAQAAAA